ncbi:CBS domain-containing protein [Caenorhabditis elegans]|uniref:CBS domain-containing protein n=1 Tax=Caenorhabditis elegans TaxID=6239 RepID=A0A1I6CM90_CAEEL|nr:CBS domain-containing protein [Caenorhabditis elegans]SFQ94285.1 CBS domain-containing protein [Caenorhabditis elegans]|eukprot:NP_001334214.1 AMP-Activated protein Kinase Gamma subunit [Caenorhabditis elegans]
MATVSPSNLVFPPPPSPDPYTQRSGTPSALLVFLAATPSSQEDEAAALPGGAISPRRRWSSTKEQSKSAPGSARRVEKSFSFDGEPTTIDRYSCGNRTSLETMIEQEPEHHGATEHEHPSPLPSKGLIRKFRKRILSSDKSFGSSSSSNPCSSSRNGLCSNNSGSSSSSSGGANSGVQQSSVHPSNSYSPRSRPLFVDTQMANHLQDSNMKRRSPVSQVVDFVRGRNRTYSLQLSSSPMCSPQSVAARASASCDGCNGPPPPPQPIGMSPSGRRQTISGRVHRASFTAGGTLKSFDSGLDLSSPTINHTALLIKEASLFSSFDSMSIGTAVPDINAIFFDNHDAVYSLFMKAHKCYDLIPTSSKLVVFDTHLPVRKAFYALVYNGVRAAPLWDTDNQRFTGMLTITDFIKILCKHYDKGDNSERIRALEDQQISHWRDQFELDGTLRPFVYIDPNESLHRAVELLCESKVHRLPVLDRKTGNITYILTHKRIMKFLSLYMRDLPRPSFMSCTPRELGIGAWGDILCCHVDTPIHDALELFLKNRVSALPLIDENGRVVDIYAKFDVISLAAESSYDKLDCTVQEALQHRSEWFEGVQTCLETDSLFQVLEAIVKAEVHRLIVTDQDKKVVGVVSLSDILKNLVLDPCQKPPPPPPQSQQAGGGGPPTRNASGTSTGGASSSDSPPHSIPEGIEVEDDDDDDEEAPPPSIDCSTPGPSSAAT